MLFRTCLFSGIALSILLFADCATAREADVVQAGCRMLPTSLRFIDSRISNARLEQDRSGCYFEGTASSLKVADAQKSILAALVTSRCGTTVVTDAKSRSGKGGMIPNEGVPIRVSLVQSAPDSRCSIGGVVQPKLEEHEYEVQIVHRPFAHYPPAAFMQGREGELRVIVLLNDRLETIGAVVEKSSGYDDFDEAALTATRQWRFKGQTSRPGTVFFPVPVVFRKN
ncbi:Gram-negative bacterial tonB protein [compost metagenome]